MDANGNGMLYSYYPSEPPKKEDGMKGEMRRAFLTKQQLVKFAETGKVQLEVLSVTCLLLTFTLCGLLISLHPLHLLGKFRFLLS